MYQPFNPLLITRPPTAINPAAQGPGGNSRSLSRREQEEAARRREVEERLSGGLGRGTGSRQRGGGHAVNQPLGGGFPGLAMMGRAPTSVVQPAAAGSRVTASSGMMHSNANVQPFGVDIPGLSMMGRAPTRVNPPSPVQASSSHVGSQQLGMMIPNLSLMGRPPTRIDPPANYSSSMAASSSGLQGRAGHNLVTENSNSSALSGAHSHRERNVATRRPGLEAAVAAVDPRAAAAGLNDVSAHAAVDMEDDSEAGPSDEPMAEEPDPGDDDIGEQSLRPRRTGVPSCYRPRANSEDKGPGEGSMHFCVMRQQRESFERFSDLRRRNALCDVVLIAGDDDDESCGDCPSRNSSVNPGSSAREFPCHRVVLASASDYFHSMFTLGLAEEGKRRVKLHDVPADILAPLVEFMYTAEIVVSEQNVCRLMQAAMMLQLAHVTEACTTFVGHQLDASNCLGIGRFAAEYQCDELLKKAERYALRNFARVCKEEEFMTMLDANELGAIVSSDDLHVVCETEVYKAVVTWVNHEPLLRAKHLYDLLLKVRLPLIAPKFLQEELRCNQTLRSCTSCVSLIKQTFEALRSHRPCEWDPRVRGEVIYCVGGFLRHSLTNVECYDTVKSSWRRVADLPQARSGLGAVSLRGILYAVGGRNICCAGNNVDTAQVDAYNPETNAWTSVAPMSEPRYRMGVCVLDSCLYAVGGLNGPNAHRTMEKFCPTIGKWTSAPPMNDKRVAMGVAVVNRFLYAMGGSSGGDVRLRSVEKYDPEEEKWTVCTPMNSPRSGAGVCALDHYVYVAGGYDSHVQLNSLERYDTQKNSWETLSPMKTVRSAVSMVAFEGKLYVFGGYGNNEFFQTVERYDPVRDEWSDATQMTSGRAGPASAVGLTPSL